MKQKKTIRIAVVVLSIILLAVMVWGALSLYKSSKYEKEILEVIRATWEEAKSDEQPAFLTKVEEKSNYEIVEIEPQEELITVMVEISSPNVKKVMFDLDKTEIQEQNEETVNAFLNEQIEKADIVETLAPIYVVKTEAGYQVSFSDVFVDAMSGYLYSYSEEAMLQMLEQQKEGEQ